MLKVKCLTLMLKIILRIIPRKVVEDCGTNSRERADRQTDSLTA